ncbi:nucleolar and coiled-body phosphoprotein 1 isoform X1 [Acanthopagrus latus]|uniref:nucleolar and coiled-body phosphoprotein 1 isoform X1 n=1 Tax=Acanthopagrus latus TaxID=8177 RepID=UPI00187C2C23|nr:nucleolar and coiled-body phosphoprotein 1 isoform X1 [Acanthopagrus latus]XP_036974367.1 nucleolar and coiled-body phosphoprotein 1 isoform X1 [Acanthopagrus latus]
MLQQILKDMYIDPDVLEALNEDQKKTLFLKMRQEQVRRWTEREEKLEREGGDKRTKPKKANSKNVSWLLGRDGDVAVVVIGEVDELNELSSKFICSGFGEKKAPNPQSNSYHQTILKSRKPTEAVRSEKQNSPPKTQPGISLDLKGKREETSTLLPLPVSVSEHSSPPAAAAAAAAKPESKSASATEEKSAPQPSICSRSPMRASPVNVRPASANAAPGSVNTRPGLANLRLAAAALSASPSSTVKIDSGATIPTKVGLRAPEPQKPKESQGGKDIGASQASRRAAPEEPGSSGSTPTCAGRGRVAQLMKTFSVENTASPAQTPPRGIKPPLPSKPSHLRLTTTPTVR